MAGAKPQRRYEFTIVVDGTMYQCKRFVTGRRALTQTVHVAGFGSAIYGAGRVDAGDRGNHGGEDCGEGVASRLKLEATPMNIIPGVLLLLIVGPGAAADKEAMPSLYKPAGLKWQDGPASIPAGAKLAILEGDPEKDGPFVMRLKLPDGYRIPPHIHPKPERVTVISGTFNIGMGDKFDASKGEPMPAGTFGTWPAGMKHFVWAKGETVIQLHGVGPWTIQYVDPKDDPRKDNR
jgi:hypothetical protein